MTNTKDYKDGYAAAIEALKKQLNNNQNNNNSNQMDQNGDEKNSDKSSGSKSGGNKSGDKGSNNNDSNNEQQDNMISAQDAINKKDGKSNKADNDSGGDSGGGSGSDSGGDSGNNSGGDSGNNSGGGSGSDSGGGSGSDSGGDSGGDSSNGTGKMAGKQSADLSGSVKYKEKGDKIIEKYRNSIGGALGNFIKQCKSSIKGEKNGLAIQTTNKGYSSWNKKLQLEINAFIKKKIFQKRRKYEQTYTRLKRGSGFVKFGEPINPGTKLKEDTFNLNVAFYIDRSGSMSNCIDKVFSAVKAIGDALRKNFAKEPVIDKTEFKSWAFDYSIKELPWGKTCGADGGTMPFQDLLKNVEKNSKDFLINIIITDAQFDSVDDKNVKHFLDKIEGILYFITNEDNYEIKKIANDNKYKTKLIYILADKDYNI